MACEARFFIGASSTFLWALFGLALGFTSEFLWAGLRAWGFISLVFTVSLGVALSEQMGQLHADVSQSTVQHGLRENLEMG